MTDITGQNKAAAENALTQNNKNVKNKELESSAALWILFGLIAISVVFLLSMRYIERNKIIKESATVYVSTPVYTERKEISEQMTKININTAGKEELMMLPGIGSVKAQAILDYRKEYGYFYNLDELMKIPGIGASTINKIKDHIVVE